MKRFRYLIEAAGACFLFTIFRCLPCETASNLGGWLGRLIGTRMATSRKALANIHRALPGKTDSEYSTILKMMWDNLGRVFAEYPHLEKIARQNVKIEGLEILEKLRDDNKPAILFGGHFSNWEIVAPAILEHNLEIDLLYRRPNNPYIDKMLEKSRSLNGKLKTYPKSRSGMKAVVGALARGRHLGILIDQKYNEGIPSKFMGHAAMTSPAFIQLAQKFKCPLVPGFGVRHNGNHFVIHVFEPLEIFDSSGAPLPVEQVMGEAHKLMESWVKQYPQLWLWLHRRWTERAEKEYKERYGEEKKAL
jgi:KDO2-lipid IV(A) lauroyltransferase